MILHVGLQSISTPNKFPRTWSQLSEGTGVSAAPVLHRGTSTPVHYECSLS